MTRRRLPAFAVLAITAAVAAVAFALAGGGASAATGGDTYSSCLKHAQSTFDMDQCVANERKRLKPLLAAAYNKLLTDPGSNAQRKHMIALSEKAWTTYEKRDCAYAGSAAQGGTLAPIIQGECLVDRTRTRIADLKQFAVPLGR
jgi:uncharacterized protein YecT (DUF1311 family)